MTATTNEHPATHDLVCDAVEHLRGGDLVLGTPELDCDAAAMLEMLTELHQSTGINGKYGIDLDVLPEVRDFALRVLGYTDDEDGAS